MDDEEPEGDEGPKVDEGQGHTTLPLVVNLDQQLRFSECRALLISDADSYTSQGERAKLS